MELKHLKVWEISWCSKIKITYIIRISHHRAVASVMAYRTLDTDSFCMSGTLNKNKLKIKKILLVDERNCQ